MRSGGCPRQIHATATIISEPITKPSSGESTMNSTVFQMPAAIRWAPCPRPITAPTMPPSWVIWCCYIAIGLGTMFGGWRIVKTMGQKITKLKPVGGFCAEAGGAMTLFLATALGIPVSTTHTITGAIVGVGSVRRASAVRWGVAGNIVWAWIFTIPASAFVASIAYWVGLQIF
jgi:PiT family inorganic phosphate transporter